ncbi:MAG: hypothetical protein RQ867_07300 [Mariprofundaceae bacterium]|nr:hypothetical protein [Mariprofundaceae bacterium]
MIRNLIIKLMALAFVSGVAMTPAMADSRKHDSNYKASKHDKKDKYKTRSLSDEEKEKLEKRRKEHEDHNRHPEKY